MRRIMRRFLRREDGTASIELVFMLPIVMSIFMASFESAYYMARSVMMERGLDIVMRQLRLGQLGTISHTDLKTAVCTKAAILVDCALLMKIELLPVDTGTFAMPATPPTCVDRSAGPINPATEPPASEYNQGNANQIMLVRACVRQTPLFPTTGMGLRLPTDGVGGGYALVAVSVFVNEPV